MSVQMLIFIQKVIQTRESKFGLALVLETTKEVWLLEYVT